MSKEMKKINDQYFIAKKRVKTQEEIDNEYVNKILMEHKRISSEFKQNHTIEKDDSRLFGKFSRRQ